jgi:hypothetical protein
MNSIKCPQCGLVNWGAPHACKRCGLSFEGISAESFVSIPAGEQLSAPGFPNYGVMAAEETAQTRKVWKWFVTYCVLMFLMYLFLLVAGGVLLFLDLGSFATDRDAGDIKVQAVAFFIVGIIFAPVYATGLFVKGKSWGWIYGIVLIAIGMTSCCLWPITIPLLIQWIKPEMKRMFGIVA